MNWNKLARWASVAAFSAIVPAAAMASVHHSRLTHPTTAPSALTTHHIKSTAGKKALVSKLATHSTKAKAMKTTKHKLVALKSKKISTSKLVSRKRLTSKLTAKKHAVSTLAAKKHIASKLMSTKIKSHALSTHKAIKPAAKPLTPVAPTM